MDDLVTLARDYVAHNAAESRTDVLLTAMADEMEGLRALAIDMGRAIRRLDDDNEHLEFWTQDGDYVLDGRFRRG